MFQPQELVPEITRLHKFALHLTGNVADAEDLVQSTALRALENKHQFKDGTDVFKWCSKIQFNLFVSGYRRRVKFESQYDPEPIIQMQKTPANQYQRMRCIEANEAMQKMNKEHSQVLNAICVNGVKYKHLAKELGVPVGTVRSRLYRARKNLQEALSEK
jgi:RNA polymerase sigma-70 factor (ECF subfamily)